MKGGPIVHSVALQSDIEPPPPLANIMPSLLSRILETEYMDTPEEAREYDSMNHAAVNAVFVSDFLTFHPAPRGKILDVGTGTAQIPIELCQRAEGFEVVAVDAAEHMLELARKNVEAAGLTSRIRLVKADAKAFAFPTEAFQAVISNSIVHHIPDPYDVLAEMVRVCDKGGVLFVRDLFRPYDARELQRIVDTYAADADEQQRRMFADSLHAALTLSEIQSLISQLGFAAMTVTKTTDRHWTWATGVE